MRRFVDCIFCLVLIPFCLPIALLISFFIKISSPGPIFFKSLRIGLNGKPFACLKFRTMYHENFSSFEKLINCSAYNKEWSLYHKLKKDPRVYPFGAFLRKTSLDELPQLINILKKEMTLIGPRPFLIKDLEPLDEKDKKKFLSISPGLTGLWQVSGRSLLSFEKRKELENFYIDNRCFVLDLKILIKTLYAVISCKGAF